MIREQDTRSQASLVWIPLLLLSLVAAAAAVFYPVLAMASIGLLIGGTIAVMLSARRPEIFLVLAIWTNFLKALYLPGLSVGEFGATPYLLFTTLAVIGFSIQVLSGKRRLILPIGLIPFFLFASFTTLSLLIAQDFRIAFGSYVRTIFDWAMYFLLSQMIVDRRNFQRLMNAILVQAVVVVVWGIIAGIEVEILDVQRRALLFWDQFQKNDFAAYLGVVLVVSLATFLIEKKRLNKWTALFLMFLVPVAWMFTFSRGGLLAIVVCLLVFISLERRKRLLQRLIQITALILITGSVVIAVSRSETRDLAIEGLKSLVGSENVAERHIDTIEFRFLVAEAAVEVFFDRPLLGVGFNQWQLYSPHTRLVYDPQAGELRETGSSIHNRLLMIATNSGIIALIGYLFFTATVFVVAQKSRDHVGIELRAYLNAFIAALVGIQVALLFAPTMVWEWPVFGILAGLINLAEIEKAGDLAKHRWLKLNFLLRK